MSVQIRRLSKTDDLASIAALVRAAYAPHAANGLRYWGTHQTAEDTAQRFATGTGFVMLEDARFVGTIIVRPPNPESPVPLYRNPFVWTFAQFCVSPECKGKGYGKRLHAHALSTAASEGATVIALDTAAPAKALISMYESWGYRIVDRCDWRPQTNYESVVMSLDLENAPANMGKRE